MAGITWSRSLEKWQLFLFVIGNKKSFFFPKAAQYILILNLNKMTTFLFQHLRRNDSEMAPFFQKNFETSETFYSWFIWENLEKSQVEKCCIRMGFDFP